MAAPIQCGCGMDCSSDPSPSLGTSICHGFSCKKGKRVKLGNLPGVWLIAEFSQTTLCVAPVPCLNYGNSEVHYFFVCGGGGGALKSNTPGTAGGVEGGAGSWLFGGNSEVG